LIRIDNELESFVSELASKLRKENLSVDFDYLQRSVKAQMREANKLNAKYVIFVGGDEYKQGLMNLKNMSTGEEEKISIDLIREPALLASRFVAKINQR
jgi:histidyl-tRNA synthetase